MHLILNDQAKWKFNIYYYLIILFVLIVLFVKESEKWEYNDHICLSTTIQTEYETDMILIPQNHFG